MENPVEDIDGVEVDQEDFIMHDQDKATHFAHLHFETVSEALWYKCCCQSKEIPLLCHDF